MATGSEDYWMTKSNFMAGIMQAFQVALGEDGVLKSALDTLDGHLDGVIDLSALNHETLGLLAKLTGINTSLVTGSELLNKLDNLDGKADGKLDVSKLTDAETGWLKNLFKTDTLDGDGKNLLTKLDSLDGKDDGILDVSKLTDAETGWLKNLFKTDTLDGGGKNLLTKLDNLDGVADGVLDLSKLETMDIFYDAVAEKSRLLIALEKLTEQLTELSGVHSDTGKIVDSSKKPNAAGYDTVDPLLVSPSNQKLLSSRASRAQSWVTADILNGHNVFVGYDNNVSHTVYVFKLNAGETADFTNWTGEVWACADGANQVVRWIEYYWL